MAVLLTTSAGVFQWNLKELVPRKKFNASSNDGILSSAVNNDRLPQETFCLLTIGDEVAVSDEGGITLFSLANDAQRKLKGIKVSLGRLS